MQQVAHKHLRLEVKLRIQAKACSAQDLSSLPLLALLEELVYSMEAVCSVPVQLEAHFLDQELQVAHYLVVHQLLEDLYLAQPHLSLPVIMLFSRLLSLIRMVMDRVTKKKTMITSVKVMEVLLLLVEINLEVLAN